MLFGTVGAARTYRKTTKGGRYDRARIAARLEAARALAGIDPKDLYCAIWPNQKPDSARSSWHRRIDQLLKDFELGELEAAVDLIEKKLGYSLPGFPFIDFGEALKLAEARRGPSDR
jgi:hypothetical protein